MTLIIEQRFPLGRFHATRWKQNPFEDRFGEWPPSPWRLLRALAARWFQYAREMEDFDKEKRNTLFSKIASSLPIFSLPEFSFSGTPIIQYQPTGIDWTDKSKKAAGVKRPQSTKTEDHYRALPGDVPLYWIWENIDIDNVETTLLDHLLQRTLYFGRAESYSRLRRIECLPDGVRPNCHLFEHGNEDMPPVLIIPPGKKLDIETLLSITDDKVHFKGRSSPMGTAWYYAQLPACPSTVVHLKRRPFYTNGLHCLQFAVGGRVLPPLSHWIKVTERFRGRVIRSLAEHISPFSNGRYDRLTYEERNGLDLITVKDVHGKPLQGHQHAFLILWPDDNGLPTRLIIWRKEAFTGSETEAFLRASEKPLAWDNGMSNWKLCIVPLPFETPTPQGLLAASKTWISATPFVPPANRYRFRKNGKLRTNEAVESILSNLLIKQDMPGPKSIIRVADNASQSWLKLHESRSRRFSKEDGSTSYARPGFRFRIEFPTIVQGPIILGDSAHFGLGLFVPEKGVDP